MAAECRWCGQPIEFNRTIRKWVTGGAATKDFRCYTDALPVRVHEPPPADDLERLAEVHDTHA